VKNAVTEPAAQPSAPPYRYHSPAVVAVMITLPLGLPLARTNDARIQPTAGSSAAPNVPKPQPQAAHVAKITTARMIAISGAGDRLYWKLPIRPWTAPSKNSVT
jgi:hypothetical protein